jgi:hypothetical protein
MQLWSFQPDPPSFFPPSNHAYKFILTATTLSILRRIAMSCLGHCFDFTSLEAPSSFHELIEESLQVSTSQTTELYTYIPLEPWQTRILRLHSSKFSQQLSADLLVATVCDIEDLLVVSTGTTVEYTALSYSWGRPELCETLICDERKMPISRSNAAALIALRSPTEPTYVWIDAICINQKNDQEKSAQVARMLNIYQKAQSVTVWLGEPDAGSLLAFACVHELSKLQEEMLKLEQTTHVPFCYDQLRSISQALLSLYDRLWLRRTWIRQEIYGARRLAIYCGLQQISWDQFTEAADLIKTISTGALMKDGDDVLEFQDHGIGRLLTEAARNAKLPPSGVKPPRDLVEVLLQARYFEASEPKDTFYAILGMCDVVAYGDAKAQRRQDFKGAVLVDYKKSLVAVYQDATSCILHRKGEPHMMANLWHSYKRGPLRAEGLPSWAVDWRTGTFEDSHRATLRECLQSEKLRTPLPLLLGGDMQNIIPDESAVITRAWDWPEPRRSDPKVLLLPARVLNYVAYLTDFTCEPGQFVETKSKNLGLTARAIHGKRMLRDLQAGHVVVHPNPKWEKFSPESHAWRVALLGVGNDGQLCLVPSTTQKGDLIVAIAPGLLAMTISSTQGDQTVGGLIPRDDPYADITKEACRKPQLIKNLMFLCDFSMVILMPFTAGFITSLFYTSRYPSVAAKVYMGCYCAVLLILILGDVARSYLRTLDFHPWTVSWMRLTLLLFQCFSLNLGNLCAKGIYEVKVDAHLELTIGLTGIAVFIDLVGHALKIHRRIRVHMAIASRRIDVFKGLDNATNALGQDFEFRGPVLVSHYNRHLEPGSHWAIAFLELRYNLGTFMLCVRSQFQHRQYPNERRTEHAEMRSSVHDNFTVGKSDAWKRPIQEFRLH